MTTLPFHRMKSPRQKSSLRRTDMGCVAVGHALIDDCSIEEACRAIITHAKGGGSPAYITTANAQHIVLLNRDEHLREIYDQADLVVPDGFSLLLAARLYGRRLRERVAGVDMIQRLCKLAAETNLRVFLLGGLPHSADAAAQRLQEQYARLTISTYCPPLGFEKSAVGLQAVADAIRIAKPDLLFVALGAPKQEYWIFEHGLRLSSAICIGVGGSFEMIAGVMRRAPLWIQNAGCEWLYRLCLEPRRMWRRYLIGNLQFAVIVGRQRIRRAILNTFFNLVDKGDFAAELYEPGLQTKWKSLASDINSPPADISERHTSDALAG